ncbi:MAG: hypothetical protein SGARI_004210, partial [Bacillariaceae sp.]
MSEIIRLNHSTIGNSYVTIYGNGNVITGSSVTVFGDNNQIQSSYSEVTGNGNTVNGFSASVNGDRNRVTGSYSEVTGNGNTVNGSSASAYGDRNRVTGSYSSVQGNDNVVSGTSASATGNRNTVSGSFSEATGDNNTISGESCSANGNHNQLSGQWANATGSNNVIDGVPAEQAVQQEIENAQRRVQQLQQVSQQRSLSTDEFMEHSLLAMAIQSRQQLNQLQQLSQQMLSGSFASIFPSHDVQQAVPAFTAAPPRVQQAPQQQRQTSVRQHSVASSQPQPAATTLIQLNLRGEDEEVVESSDENHENENARACLICMANKAVVASFCCGNRTTCLACSRKLYQDKEVGKVKCMNCRAVVER